MANTLHYEYSPMDNDEGVLYSLTTWYSFDNLMENCDISQVGKDC